MLPLIAVEERQSDSIPGPSLEPFGPCAVRIEDRRERQHARALPAQTRARRLDRQLRGTDVGTRGQCIVSSAGVTAHRVEGSRGQSRRRVAPRAQGPGARAGRGARMAASSCARSTSCRARAASIAAVRASSWLMSPA